jgi:(2Fe-2S) ferredoxin
MEKDLSKIKKIIYLCNGTSCTNKGAEENITALRNSLTEQNLNDEIHTIRTKCSGFCKKGPIIGIQPENTWYQEMDVTSSTAVVTTHILRNTVLEDQLLFSSTHKIVPFVPQKNKTNFFTKYFSLRFF